MKNILASMSLMLAIFAAGVARADSAKWYADFDEAVAAAKAQNKDLFVDFTGTDWCGWCIRLHKEVFAHKEFEGPAQKMYILVALDFPRGEEAKAKVPNPKRNDELKKKYGIRGFPTCLLMTPDGDVFGRMGYQAGGPDQYVKDMQAKTKLGKKLIVEVAKLKEEYKNASDTLPVIERAVAMLATMSSDSPGVSSVADMAMQGLKRDAQNTTGLKARAMGALLGSGQANKDIATSAREMDAANKLGLLEKAVKYQFATVVDEASAKAAIDAIEGLLDLGTIHDSVDIKGMAAAAAEWCGRLGDAERGVALATRANALDGELAAGQQQVLDRILKQG